jgi:hypothetical protein
MRRRLLALMIGAAIAAVAVPSAHAQSPEQSAIAGGYSFLSEIDTPGLANDYPAGWFASFHSTSFFTRISIAGEVTGSQRRNELDETQRLLAILAGPRIGVFDLGRLHISAAVLLGREWFSEPGFKESGLAVEPGVALDLPIAGRAGARIGTGYRVVQAGGDTFKELRVSAGGVLWLGAH